MMIWWVIRSEVELLQIYDFPKKRAEKMSNFERVRKIKEENRKKSDTRREKLAGYFFDLSKLSFAGLIVGLILPLFSDISDVTNWLSVLFGVLLTIIPALLANKILK
ncbi:MAG: hypothetical protein UDG28_03165 [Prevotellamassilia sp.]|nr:hypothetical protein [Prevotellamassilia sp.]